MYFGIGIEIAVLRFNEDGNWHIDYCTPITNDVIGGLDEKTRDNVFQQIFELKNVKEMV